MKFLFTNLLILSFCYASAQNNEQKTEIVSFFNNYAICKCITQSYWMKGIKTEDRSITYWNDKLPLSSNSVEQIENYISEYIVINIISNDSILKNCILITNEKKFIELIDYLVKHDSSLKMLNYTIKN
jgi:hypothetical protein